MTPYRPQKSRTILPQILGGVQWAVRCFKSLVCSTRGFSVKNLSQLVIPEVTNLNIKRRLQVVDIRPGGLTNG